ncbi:serine/threonine protein kinase [Kribbella qitaiheensis]|uniref:non-specific serine/threonine protein kinase n=1 Tax=Kribbella qitaiheensis TaxID=1544730 RepID=A0A7G6WSE7_9ACTN|nr:serine/threonine-protein kinase [Kribbella qitaiheensis]QNE16912.1 serine/threonine protein kinase [Kribbella qitaiheensis]
MRVADRYQLETVVGQGGMGRVWRATDEVLGRAVAVKLLKQGRADDAVEERFHREAHAAAVVNNPHVVGVHDFGPHQGSFFLVMELVVGSTLAAVLQRSGPFSPPAAARIVAQAADGLSAAHREGVIHRDIKPSNLLMAGDGTVKVADFGIACFLGDPAGEPTHDGRILGTSYYVAPERARDEPAGPAADIYSLGCVLYQLLTGGPPFVADTPTGVLRQHLAGTPTCPARLERGFGRYLMRMLAKSPADRPAADEVADWCRQAYLSAPTDLQPEPGTPAQPSFLPMTETMASHG